MPIINWVKTLPSRDSFGDKRVRVRILPPYFVVVVEVSKTTHAVEMYLQDFVLNIRGTRLEQRFKPEVVNRWEGKLASTTDIGEYLTRIHRHNFKRWSWCQEELKKIDKFIPREIPKDVDLQPYLDEIAREVKRDKEGSHTVRDAMLKAGTYGLDNPYIYQNPPLDDWKPSKALENLVKKTQGLVSGEKQDEVLPDVITGMGAIIGGTVGAYTWKSPFYIQNLVKAKQLQLDLKMAEMGLKAPVLKGLSGLPEIVGQPFWGAALSFESLMASSHFSTEYRTKGQKQVSLSEKLTKEELAERLKQHALEDQDRKGRQMMGLSLWQDTSRDETEKERGQRIARVEAMTRYTTGVGIDRAVNSRQKQQLFRMLGVDTKLRPVQEQLALYLEMMVIARRESDHLKPVFAPEYLDEFEKLPELGAFLTYRWKHYQVVSVDISPKRKGGVAKTQYLITATSRTTGGIESITLPYEELTLVGVNSYVRPSMGFRQVTYDIMMHPLLRIPVNLLTTYLTFEGFNRLKNQLGWAKADVRKKVAQSKPGVGPIVDHIGGVGLHGTRIRKRYTEGITMANYEWAAHMAVVGSMATAVEWPNIFQWVVGWVDTPQPFPLSEVVDRTMPRGMRSYRDLATQVVISQVPVSSSVKGFVSSMMEAPGKAYKAGKEFLSKAATAVSDTVTQVFYGVAFLAGIGILYKIVN